MLKPWIMIFFLATSDKPNVSEHARGLPEGLYGIVDSYDNRAGCEESEKRRVIAEEHQESVKFFCIHRRNLPTIKMPERLE